MELEWDIKLSSFYSETFAIKNKELRDSNKEFRFKNTKFRVSNKEMKFRVSNTKYRVSNMKFRNSNLKIFNEKNTANVLKKRRKFDVSYHRSIIVR